MKRIAACLVVFFLIAALTSNVIWADSSTERKSRIIEHAKSDMLSYFIFMDLTEPFGARWRYAAVSSYCGKPGLTKALIPDIETLKAHVKVRMNAHKENDKNFKLICDDPEMLSLVSARVWLLSMAYQYGYEIAQTAYHGPEADFPKESFCEAVIQTAADILGKPIPAPE